MTITSQDIALSLASRANGLTEGLELYERLRACVVGREADDLVTGLGAVLEALNDDWAIFLRKRAEEACAGHPAILRPSDDPR
jgi:hypothetical protein